MCMGMIDVSFLQGLMYLKFLTLKILLQLLHMEKLVSKISLRLMACEGAGCISLLQDFFVKKLAFCMHMIFRPCF